MFIAHIPAAFLVIRLLNRKPLPISTLAILSVGGIFPDVDLLRFYLLDNAQRHHHEYWTHIPFIWFLIFALTLSLTSKLKPSSKPIVMVFFIAIFTHLIADSLVGDIQWLWPFNNHGFPLVVVPAKFSPWYLSFIFHWTFLLELCLTLSAAFILIKDKLSRSNDDHPKTKIPLA